VDHALETGLRHRLRRALRRMEGQHLHLRPLLAEIDDAVRAGALAEIGERLTRLRDALSAHFELEESVLFPALHGLSPGSARDLTQLAEEHRAFLSELLHLAGGDGRARSAEAISRLRSALAAHEKREERLLASFVSVGDAHSA
jgi:hypothetical protein